MNYLSFDNRINNSKLFFSKSEFTKILSCYSYGVSKGNWKDYSFKFKKNEASFLMFKHTSASPDCILTKYKKFKKKGYIFNLESKNFKNNESTKIDELLIKLRRNYIKVIK